MIVLAHAGHVHTEWPLWSIVALATAGSVLVIATAWFVSSELRGRRVLRTSPRKKAREAAASSLPARRFRFAAIAAVTVLTIAGVLAFGRSTSFESARERFAGAPEPTASDQPGGPFTLEFVRTTPHGTFSAVVTNRSRYVVYLECTIETLGEDGRPVTTHTYRAYTPSGAERRSEFYTNHRLMAPGDDQQFGADVTVSAPVRSYGGRCFPVPVTDTVREAMPEEAIALLHPDSR